jgi:hypothetical protein
MYSVFDSQYLWNKVTMWLQFLRGERVIMRVRSDYHQRLNSVDAAELLSELRLLVCLV